MPSALAPAGGDLQAPLAPAPSLRRKMQKALLPLDGNDYLVVVLTFFASALGAAGGIGGGGIMVPMLVSLGGFSVHHAIPLTQATVFGASIMNLVHNFKKRHPDFDRPLIDYHTALMLEVTTLLGTVVGVDLNSTSPVWLITILLILVLSFTTHRTLKKGLELRKKESEPQGGAGTGETGGVASPSKGAPSFRADGGDGDGEDGDVEGFDESEALMGPMGDIEMDVVGPADVEGGIKSPGKQSKAACIESLLEEDRHVPWRQVWRMGAVSVVVLAISLAKGGREGSFLVQCDSLEYWAIKVSTIPLLTLVAWYCGRELVRRDNLKVRSGYRFQSSEMQWTSRAALHYPIVCISAGVAAGLLGIGGGMLKGPIMLEMGLPPQVVAATAAYMLFWTTASTSIQFGIMGEMLWDYGALLFVVGVLSSIVGQEVLSWFVAKYKKQYFITILIALVIGFSTIFMGKSTPPQALAATAGTVCRQEQADAPGHRHRAPWLGRGGPEVQATGVEVEGCNARRTDRLAHVRMCAPQASAAWRAHTISIRGASTWVSTASAPTNLSQ